MLQAHINATDQNCILQFLFGFTLNKVEHLVFDPCQVVSVRSVHSELEDQSLYF